MKKLIPILIAASLLGFNFLSDVEAAVRVKGYYRNDGTYVQPHYRSNPDGNPYNNWSYPGNVNPYTGEVAPGNPSTYLDNYYGGSSNNNTYSGTNGVSSIRNVAGGYFIGSALFCDTGYYKQNDTCKQAPTNSVAYGGTSFYCNSGYQPNAFGTGCDYVDINKTCQNKYGSEAYGVGDTCYYCNAGYKLSSDKASCIPNYTKPTYQIKSYVKRIADFVNTPCESIGFVNPADINSCNFYKTYRNNYNWQVLGF